MTLAEIFDALFSGFYKPGLWVSARWTLNARSHRYPVYEGIIGVNVSDSEVYCFGTFIRQSEKDGPLKSHRFMFVWEKDITCEDFFTPGLCEVNNMAVAFEAGVGLFSTAFKESVENKCVRMLEKA